MEPSRPIPVLKRQARLLSRELGIPLHAALDVVAKQQGSRSWSHLSATATAPKSARDWLKKLEPGDFVLLAARPRQGKTALSLQLVLEVIRAGRAAAFFTLEFTEPEVVKYLGATASDEPAVRQHLLIDTSDEIRGDYIIRRLAAADPGTLVVVDYLQLLDQRRSNPDLNGQIAALREFTSERELITICLSQVDREFEVSERTAPTVADVRLPNFLDLQLFTKAWFVQGGQITNGDLG